MSFLKSLWDAFGDIVDARTEAAKTQKLKGFVGAVPIYGKRGPNVFLPDPDEDPQRDHDDQDQTQKAVD